MVFSSFLFLFAFLPITVVLYFVAPKSSRNALLLILSYLFYAWGAPTIAPLLFVMSFFDFAISRHLGPDGKFSVRTKKTILVLGIATNLSLLVYYKYWNFFLGELNSLIEAYGFEGVHWSEVLLPIGISFFTFQKISYLVDVYRGTAKRAESLIQYALYVALFPQLIAGPIVRYHEIAEQLKTRTHTLEKFTAGLTRFSIGLAKKVLIADFLGQSVDAIFALQSGELTTSFAWFGILAYTFQIYFDFSGYSDMAIGIGLLFGFTLPENFRNPYLARSFRDFWTRWHITLSNWMKEYLYIPLGGNRGSELRTAVNLWIVFLLSGLWHGASWNFVLWGAYHGLFLSLERALGIEKQATHWRLAPLIVFPLIVFSWVLFRADTVEHATAFYQHLLGLQHVALEKPFVWGELVQSRTLFVFWIAIALSFLFVRYRGKAIGNTHSLVALSASYLLLLLSLVALAGIDYAPFLYFRF